MPPQRPPSAAAPQPPATAPTPLSPQPPAAVAPEPPATSPALLHGAQLLSLPGAMVADAPLGATLPLAPLGADGAVLDLTGEAEAVLDLTCDKEAPCEYAAAWLSACRELSPAAPCSEVPWTPGRKEEALAGAAPRSPRASAVHEVLQRLGQVKYGELVRLKGGHCNQKGQMKARTLKVWSFSAEVLRRVGSLDEVLEMAQMAQGDDGSAAQADLADVAEQAAGQRNLRRLHTILHKCTPKPPAPVRILTGPATWLPRFDPEHHKRRAGAHSEFVTCVTDRCGPLRAAVAETLVPTIDAVLAPRHQVCNSSQALGAAPQRFMGGETTPLRKPKGGGSSAANDYRAIDRIGHVGIALARVTAPGARVGAKESLGLSVAFHDRSAANLAAAQEAQELQAIKTKGEASDIVGLLGNSLARLVPRREDTARAPRRDGNFAIPPNRTSGGGGRVEPQAAKQAIEVVLGIGKLVQDPSVQFVATRFFRVIVKDGAAGDEAGDAVSREWCREWWLRILRSPDVNVQLLGVEASPAAAGGDCAAVVRAELAELARNGEALVRRASLRSLVLVSPRGDTGVIQALAGALEDPVVEVRASAMEMLPKVADKGDSALLAAVAVRPHPLSFVRWSAIQVLPRLAEAGDPVLVAAVSARLKSSEAHARQAAVELLPTVSHHDDQSVLAAIAHLLADEDAGVRRAAVQAMTRLPRLRDERLPKLLSGILDHPDERVQWAAIEAMMQAAPEPDEFLMTAVARWLRDRTRAVRKSAEPAELDAPTRPMLM
ncbi:unnamed protein product [Prorocentrum cordatum]|nr:unnamed protein product [Polarella glacialis]